jgi:putative hemolysin
MPRTPPGSTAPPGYPVAPEQIPARSLDHGKYAVDFAREIADVDAVQRLRFEVFNVEMGEGLQESLTTGRDQDRFDPVCHHLLVRYRGSGDVVGTYRMQTVEMARRHLGFYSDDEFTIDSLPAEILDSSVEVGRASVAKPFRNRHVLFLLWRGLASYMQHNHKRYLFGCCSISSQDPAEGRHVMGHLERNGFVHPTLRVDPRPDWVCYPPEPRDEPDPGGEAVKLPKLFSLYLRYGAKVCGPPAIDRYFKTIDYLVVLDVEDLDENSRRMYFE